jgi:hypothetical protein
MIQKPQMILVLQQFTSLSNFEDHWKGRERKWDFFQWTNLHILRSRSLLIVYHFKITRLSEGKFVAQNQKMQL